MLGDFLLLNHRDRIEPPLRPLRGIRTAERGSGLADVLRLNHELHQGTGSGSDAGYRAIIGFYIVHDPVILALAVGWPPAVQRIYAGREVPAAASLGVGASLLAGATIVAIICPPSASSEVVGNGEFFLSASVIPPCSLMA